MNHINLGKRRLGFTLVELMISLALGLVISLGIIQVMVSNRVTSQFNQTLSEVQESGRFVIGRLRNELLETGLYDTAFTRIADGVDSSAEEAFVRTHPIILAGHLASAPLLSSANSDDGNDELIISLQAQEDCNGAAYGVLDGAQQHIVNRYYVVNNELRCDGYSGRILRGLSGGNASSGTAVLMDEVESFQVQYGITDSAGTADGRAVRYVTANLLPAAEDLNQSVVAMRIGVLIQSRNRLSGLNTNTYTVLDVPNVSVETDHYGQVFTHTIALRNMKNFVRSL